MVGCQHDGELYLSSEMDVQLDAVCLNDSKQCYVHGDTGYNRRHFLDVLFSGASLSAAQRATNLATGGVRVTVKWMYQEVKLYCSISYFNRKMKCKESPVAFLYLISILVANVCTFYFRENTVSQYFEYDSLTLDQYPHHKDGITFYLF